MTLPRPALVVIGACAALALGLGGVASPAQATDLRPASLWFAVAPVPPTAANPFPGVAFITPAPSKTKLAYNTQVQVTFTGPVTTVSTSTFFVTDGRGARVAGTVFPAPVYGSGGRENTWVFSASHGFPRNAQLTVHLQGITTASGSKLPTATWAFSTGTSFQDAGLY